MCWELLRQYGPQALADAERHVCSEALETVVEVNTYLSSVGFESGGLAAAHGIQKGFTVIPQLHGQYHGNKVAFCTVTQLVMEQAPPAGAGGGPALLPRRGPAGLPSGTWAMRPRTRPCSGRRRKRPAWPGPPFTTCPSPVTSDLLYSALWEADKVGRRFQETH